MLTSAGEAIDRMPGLELGADDCLGKPFELRELLARVRAMLRRSQPMVVPGPVESAASAAVGPAAEPDGRGRVRFGAHVF